MFQALQDIKLDIVDFDWIQKATKISHLKRAIRLIQLDGDYFKQLKEACFVRLEELDPGQKRVEISNHMSREDQCLLEKELADWEDNIDKKNGKEIGFDRDLTDTEAYFTKEDKPKSLQKQAERERNKGNQAIKSKDFDEAIGYYTKSLQYNPKMYQSYGNRALVHLKKKDFQKCIHDCESALRLNQKYTKAYHRKAKALYGLKNRVQAYKTFQQALKVQPENGQINGQIQQLWQELSQPQKQQLGGNSLIQPSEFKKITIEQESDQDD